MFAPRNISLLLMLLLVPCLARPQTERDLPGSIAAALRAKEYARALPLLETALEQSPNDARLWTYRGIALAGEGKSKEALSAYRRALMISPDFSAALAGAAEILYRMGDQQAVPLLQRLVSIHPADQTSHAMLAALAYARGDCAAAIRHFERSGALVATQSDAQQQYGACLAEEGQAGVVVSVFQKLLAANADSSRARRNLAAAQYLAGHSQAARSTLSPLPEPNYPDVSTLRLAAAIYESCKDTPHAVKFLHDAIVREPGNVALYVDFANIAFNHESFQAGVDMLNAGLTVKPNAVPLLMARGVLYVQLADYEKGEADFERAEELDPRQSLSSTALGLVAEDKNQKDPEEALRTLRSELAARPNDADLLYLQSTLLAEKGLTPGSPEFRLALRSAQQAVALQPNMIRARDLVAKLYLGAGEKQLAIYWQRTSTKTDGRTYSSPATSTPSLLFMNNHDGTFREEAGRVLFRNLGNGILKS